MRLNQRVIRLERAGGDFDSNPVRAHEAAFCDPTTNEMVKAFVIRSYEVMRELNVSWTEDSRLLAMRTVVLIKHHPEVRALWEKANQRIDQIRSEPWLRRRVAEWRGGGRKRALRS